MTTDSQHSRDSHEPQDSQYSRRRFLRQLSATASLAAVGGEATAVFAENEAIGGAEAWVGGVFPTGWTAYGRLNARRTDDGTVLQDGFTVEGVSRGDSWLKFRARATQETEQVQIWAGLRCRDRDSRYVFALRGGNNDDLYLARYAPDGACKFLGIAPLGFHPEPGTWYTLRAVARGKRIQIFLGDENLPRINVTDSDALWAEGAASLGGGWLPVEFDGKVESRALADLESAAFDAIGEAVREPEKVDREKRRAEMRAAYKPAMVGRLASPRYEFSLEGNWLFLPDQELPNPDATPQAVDFDDSKWHVLGVPNFWTPTLSWLHQETAFNYLKGVSVGKGVSDRLFDAELRRLESHTFPWRETRSGWYRHHVEMPDNLAGRRISLHFDAIAKVSTVYVNGTKVGGHVGMFGEVVCDATAALQSGTNVIAVHASGHADNHRAPAVNQVLGVAVTVEVTAAMLNSLPHGMYPDAAAGIWQPVRLVVTHPTVIDDIFIKPKLDGIEAEISIHAPAPQSIKILYQIRSKSDHSILTGKMDDMSRPIEAGTTVVKIATPTLAPRPWSPWDPNLYDLELTLLTAHETADYRVTTFGFRTFAVIDGKLNLNGKPFRLSGGNHFPNALRPNDGKLARRFMQLAKDGNVVATRSHTSPFTKTWLDAADVVGMAVSFEGTWPWLMLTGDPPSDDLVTAWHDEFAALIRTHRNHPSLVMWTVNNEMKFETQDRATPDRLLKKWTILSDMVKTMRAIDPTRPISCDSSYCRASIGKSYADVVQTHEFDDGDIDDAHRYYGWYEQSFFHLFANGAFAKGLYTKGRPLISQEMSTGYPRNDDGHPTRFYLFQHHTPQTLVGDEAWEHRDPSLFLSRQAFITKELAEVFRRADRDDCAGILHFAYVTWFQNVWDADTVRPFATYFALKKALQPVLVSAELFGRHFYAGATRNVRICIANDAHDGADIPASRLVWELQVGGKAIGSGRTAAPAVGYYANGWLDLALTLPTTLPSPRVDAALVLRLERDGRVLSTNDYDVTVATPSWSMAAARRTATIALFDPEKAAPKAVMAAGLKSVSSLDAPRHGQAVVVADAATALKTPGFADSLRTFVTGGGKALLLGAGAELARVFPDLVERYHNCDGEIASMAVPESPIFEGISPLDLAWFEMGPGVTPRACRGTHRIAPGTIGARGLAHVVDRHGYLKKTTDVAAISGSPLVALQVGAGTIFASEMCLEAADEDPIAGRLLGNLLGALAT